MPCTAQSCRKLTSTAFELVFKAVAFPLHPPTPTPASAPQTPGQCVLLGVGGWRAAAPLHIHPLGFSGGFPRPWAEPCKEQAHLGSARDTRGRVGPCSGLAPRSCSWLLPGAPGQDRGFLVLCSPSARPVLYLGPAAAWAALASSPLPGRGAGGVGEGHRSRSCVCVCPCRTRPPGAAVRGCSARRALYIL